MPEQNPDALTKPSTPPLNNKASKTPHLLTRIAGHSPTEMLLQWSEEIQFSVPYVELRFYCPCAGCVDEHSGERTIRRESIRPEIKPSSAQVVGRYAVQITWNDGHGTGIYHFDRLIELCQKQGRQLF